MRQVRQVVPGLLFLRGQLRLPHAAGQQLLQGRVVVDVRHLLRLLCEQSVLRFLGVRVEGKQGVVEGVEERCDHMRG
eukprot:14929692-Alexandrium_andersonii.AAC.1